ncbi:MAG: EAL domain-containing protein [Cycloclasticus sp.]|jgi:diguanylate cyclase (GGDEF)-like protein/PAS domain S-box-containing protein|nr:EAL domain-containing protein [Cycloclasticus sp.]
MKVLKGWSLRVSVPLFTLFLYTLLLIITLIYKHGVYDEIIEKEAHNDVKVEMSRLQKLVSDGLRQGDFNRVEEGIVSMGLHHEVKLLVLVGADGMVKYSTKFEQKGQSLAALDSIQNQKGLIDFLAETGSKASAIISADGRNIYSRYSVKLGLEKAQIRSAEDDHLILIYDVSNKKTSTWNQLVKDAIWAWVAGFSIYLLLVFLFDFFINKPLMKLAAASEDLSKGDLNVRVEEKGALELVKLGMSFNAMTTKIRHSYKALTDKTALYNMLSESNQAMVRLADEKELFAETCRIMTETGGFDSAWVGLVNKETLDVESLASSGIPEDLQKKIKVSTDVNTPWSKGISAMAMITNQPIIENDIFNTEVSYQSTWLDALKLSDIQSIAALPIVINGQVIGVLTLSKQQKDFFTAEYTKLLIEVVNDLSFSVSSYRTAVEHQKSEALLSAQRVVLEKIALGSTLEDIFEMACLQINRLLKDKELSSAVCHTEGQFINSVTAPGLPGEFVKIEQGALIVKGKTPAMDAILSKERVISTLKDDSWLDFYKLAKRYNISACFSTPIFASSTNVVGTVDIYSASPRVPTYEELAIVDSLANLCGLAIERFQAIESIREREENLNVTLDSIGDAVITVDVAGRVTRLNPVASELTGWKSDDAVGKPLYEVFHIVNTQTRIVLKNPVEKVILTGKTMGLANHTSLISKDGTEYQIADSAAPILSKEGDLSGVILVFHDVTESYEAQELLRQNNQRLEALNNTLPDMVMVIDEGGLVLEFHGACDSLSMVSASEIVGKYVPEMLSIKEAEGVISAIKRTLDTKKMQVYEYEVATPNKKVYLEARVVVYQDRKGSSKGSVMWVARDISERKKAERDIERLAFYDPLTKIPNRRLLIDRLEVEVASVKRHQHYSAILFLDLDHFKTLNDSLGHNIGDSLLEQVAQRLNRQIRGEDTVARLGGDEFIILLTDLSHNPSQAAGQAQAIAEKVQHVLAAPFFLYEHEHYVSVSLGISLFSAEDCNVDDILKHADTAMYRAKGQGRNQVCFYEPEMQKTADARLQLEKDLRRAIKNSHLEPFYQPQVDHKGQCVGAEVLLRWNHPELGMISPAKFIPIAEESGLIIPLGEWVLRSSCQQVKKWVDKGLFGKNNQHFAVNISPKQFVQTDFVSTVKSIMEETGLSSELLYLEITEGMVMDKLDEAIEKMTALIKQGVRFSMDDFGTGYSSLSYLKRLPLQQLKIDRSFVMDIASDENDRAIIDVILTVCEKLKLAVVAEGVETEEQIGFLAEKGCQVFQGYYFGKPMSAKNFEQWLKTH